MIKSELGGSARGRIAATLLTTSVVTFIFGVLSLTKPMLGGNSHATATATGTLVFGIASLLLVWRYRSTDPTQKVQVPPSNGRIAVIIIAILMLILAVLMWVFTFVGTSLRFGADPIFFAVPLSIFPFLAVWGSRETRNKEVDS